MIETQSSTLFFRKYPYRIKFYNQYQWLRVRYGHDDILDDQLNGIYADIRALKRNVELDLKNMAVDYRTRHENHLTYFLEDKNAFDNLCETYKPYVYEKTVPFVDILSEIYKQYPTNVEIRKSLYHKIYRYKMTIAASRYDTQWDAKASITEVMNTLGVVDNGKWHSTGSLYTYLPAYIYFETYEQVSYAALMFQNVKIRKISEAVLQSEVKDKVNECNS